MKTRGIGMMLLLYTVLISTSLAGVNNYQLKKNENNANQVTGALWKSGLKEDSIKTQATNIEDFETGNFSRFPWQINGSWFINSGSQNVYEGNYSAYSYLGGYSESSLEVTAHTNGVDSLTFFMKKQLDGYSALHLYVDNLNVGSWGYTGNIWTKYTIPIEEGIHNIKWKFTMNHSAMNGYCAIDFISFPLFNQEISYNINALEKTYNSLTLNWNGGTEFTKHCVFIKETDNGSPLPSNYVTYLANQKFGMGSQIQNTGWFCIYNGEENNCLVTGLKPYTTYRIKICDYEGEIGNEVYNLNNNTLNPANIETEWAQFIEDTISIEGVANGNLLWADYDSDDDYDLLVTGYDNTGNKMLIYKNDTGVFKPQIQLNFPGFDNCTAKWFDYNNDNETDILITGYTSDCNCYTTRLYLNDGEATFTEIDLNVPTLSNASIYMNDYNFDGKTDFIISGFGNETTFTGLYKNEGNGYFTMDTDFELPGVMGHVSFNDIDLDGSAELFITGYNMECDCGVTNIYRNHNGTGFELLGNYGLPEIMNTYANWMDINSDGYDDLLLCGYEAGDLNTPILKVYFNFNGEYFYESGIILPHVLVSGTDWADFDNNGYIDLAITGTLNEAPYTGVFLNANGLEFSIANDFDPIQLRNSTLACADFDRDGDVDIITGGSDINMVKNVKVYKNLNLEVNNPPTVPTNLIREINSYWVTLKWDKATDIITPQDAIKYNIKIGTTQGGYDIVSCITDEESGFLKVPEKTKYASKNAFKARMPQGGTFYWSVQAIDQGILAGNFAESEFMIYDAPSIQASNILTNSNSSHTCYLNWTNGNGSRRVVFMKQDSVGQPFPVNNIEYNANAIFGKGSQIGNSGWFSVYNGLLTYATINGLEPGGKYRVAVMELNGSGGLQMYNIDTLSQNVVNFRTNWTLFSKIFSYNTGGNYNYNFKWIDYNTDKYLDLLVASNDYRGILKYTGYNSFEPANISFNTQLNGNTICIGDIDRDNNVDILANDILYRNTGSSFTEIYLSPGIVSGAIDLGDYDNDGDVDLLKCSSTIFKNNGNIGENCFFYSGIVLEQLFNGCAKWGDYDSDDDLDMIVSGLYYYFGTPHTKIAIYTNNGNDSFTLTHTLRDNPGESLTSLNWGDYNSDGNLDILLSNGGIYKNNGNKTFTNISINAYGNDACWGDFDNDGDLDIAIASDNNMRLLRNDGNDTFVNSDIVLTTELISGRIEVGDFDGDCDLDIAVSGRNQQVNNSYIYIYKNNTVEKNTKPLKPNQVNAEQDGNSIVISWNGANDNETNSDGLTYNISVSNYMTNPHYPNIMSPMADTAGKIKVAQMGNVQTNHAKKIQNLSTGDYFYKVQSVDNCFSGSEWTPIKAIKVYPAASQIINISQGWSGISSYLNIPSNIRPIEVITQPIQSKLDIMQDFTKIYYPGQGINTLDEWGNKKGYMLKVNENCSLTISGNKTGNQKLLMTEGWNILPVLTPCNISIAQFLQPIITKVKIVQEVARPYIYWYDMGINTIESLKPGRAYFIKLTDTATIEFTEQYMNCEEGTSIEIGKSAWTTPWGIISGTPSCHVLGISKPETLGLKKGDWIGVFNKDGICAGAVQMVDSELSMALIAFGNDSGLAEGEQLKYKLLRALENHEYEIEVQYDKSLPNSDGKFESHGISVIYGILFTGISDYSSLSGVKIFPNPAEDCINIKGVAPGENLHLSILNVEGQLVFEKQIWYDGKIELSNLPKGIYFLKMQNLTGVKTEKLILK